MSNQIIIHQNDFHAQNLLDQLYQSNQVGAISCFIGKVRTTNHKKKIQQMQLEYYPGMAEKALQQLCLEIDRRWNVNQCLIYHRIGLLKPGDQIVFIGTASPHRQQAIQASEFLVEALKSQIPIWKKEYYQQSNQPSAWLKNKEFQHQAIQHSYVKKSSLTPS